MERIGLVFFPTPGVGHLIPTVELGKRLLVKQPRFSITLLLVQLHVHSKKSATNNARYIQSVASTHQEIRFIHLPQLDHQPEAHPDPITSLSVLLENQKPHAKHAITELMATHRISALILDMFSTTMIDVGKELGISTYIYSTAGASHVGLMLYLPTLDERIPCALEEYDGKIEIPGLLPMPGRLLPEQVKGRREGYAWYVTHGRRFRETQCIILKTFQEFGPAILDAVTLDSAL